MITSQLQVDQSHGYIDEPTLADAILDRLVAQQQSRPRRLVINRPRGVERQHEPGGLVPVCQWFSEGSLYRGSESPMPTNAPLGGRGRLPSGRDDTRDRLATRCLPYENITQLTCSDRAAFFFRVTNVLKPVIRASLAAADGRAQARHWRLNTAVA